VLNDGTAPRFILPEIQKSLKNAGGVSSIIKFNANVNYKRRRRFIKVSNKMKFETVLENSIQNHILNFLTFAILLVIFKAQLRDEDFVQLD
jgi:hypothetical protein